MASFGSFLGLAGIGGGTIGAAIVQLQLDSTQYQAQLKAQQAQTQASANTMGSSFTKFGGLAKSGMLVAGAALVGLAANAVNAASDLTESLNKARVVFGDASESVIAFTKTTASELGIAQAEALDAAAGFGSMAQSAGLSEQASAKLSMKLVTLAADMASFNNQDPSEMLLRLRSGLAGEAEPLRKFGVFISEARVEAEAFASGIAEVGEKLTDAQKVQARFNIIMQDTAKQSGDFARTLGESLPNQIRVLKAEFTDLSAEAGQRLIPAVLNFVKALRDILPVLQPVLAALAEFLTLIGDIAQALTLGESGFDDYLGRLEKLASDFRNGKITATELQDGLRSLGNETGFLTQWTQELVDAAKQEADEFRRVQLLGEQFAHTQRVMAEAAKEHRAAVQGVTEAVLAQAEAYLALSDPVFAVISAVRDDRDAERELQVTREKLNELTAKGKEGTQAYSEALRAHREATLNAAQGQARMVATANDLRDAVAKGELKVNDAVEALRIMGKQAGLTKDEIATLVQGVRQGLDEAGRYAQAHAPDVGRAISEGIAQGIDQYVGLAMTAAANAVNAAIQAARRAAEAASPSKKMQRLGEDMIEGLIQGIESRVADAKDALARVIGNMTDLRGAISGGFSSFLDISGAFGLGGGDITSFFSSQVAGAQQFASILQALQRQGISSALHGQIASAGPQSIPFAQQLLQMGPEGIAGISGAYSTISGLASSTGRGLSESYFGSKVDELKDEIRRLGDRLEHLGDRLENHRIEDVHEGLVRLNRRNGSLQLT